MQMSQCIHQSEICVYQCRYGAYQIPPAGTLLIKNLNGDNDSLGSYSGSLFDAMQKIQGLKESYILGLFLKCFSFYFAICHGSISFELSCCRQFVFRFRYNLEQTPRAENINVVNREIMLIKSSMISVKQLKMTQLVIFSSIL